MFTKIKVSAILASVTIPQLLFAQGEASLDNPLAMDSIQELIMAIINIFRIIAVPIIVFFIIYAGFLYVTAQGNPENIKKATRALMYAIIGGVIIAGAEVIGLIVQNTANDFTSG